MNKTEKRNGMIIVVAHQFAIQHLCTDLMVLPPLLFPFLIFQCPFRSTAQSIPPPPPPSTPFVCDPIIRILCLGKLTFSRCQAI